MTTTTTLRKGRISGSVYGLKDLSGLDGNEPGTFEAIVAVFGNVDYAGDRIIAGAFGKSLAAWEASGDPIPVLFSHQWDNLDAHIGEVIESKELLPGDPLLPTELRANGGLWTKFRLELEEDFAGRVAKKLSKRTIKEFSFAYDVRDERRATDGANELLELDVLEVGPTLKGMNPATVLLARKALDDGAASDHELAAAVIESLRELGDDSLADRLEKAREGDSSSKAYVLLTGSMEERQEAAYQAAHAWAMEGNVGNGGFYAAYLEASFEDRVVVMVEGWSDPVGEGIFFELDYSIEDDGTATVSDPREVGLEVATVRKARAMKHLARIGSATGEKSAATVSDASDPGKGEGNGAKSSGGPELEDRIEGEQAPGIPPMEAVELELLGAGLDPHDPAS